MGLNIIVKLAELIQSEWIGYEQIDNLESFAEHYFNHSSILSSKLISDYFATQPALLCSILLIIFLACVTGVICCIFTVVRFCCGGCGAERYQVSHKHPTNVKWFVVFLLGFLISWLIMSACTLSMIWTSSTLNSRYEVNEERNMINHQFNGSDKDRHVIILLESVLIDENQQEPENIDEMEQLLRFKDVRELGYDFKPLDLESTHTIHSLVFWTVSIFYGLMSLITGIVVVLGTWQYLLSYHPMDRSTVSNYCGQWCISAACALFAGAPIVMIISTVFLTYSHIHETICPIVQTITQNQNMEDYINSNYYSFDPTNIIAFLNDLLIERLEINQQTCHLFVIPIQKLWFTLLLCSFISLPTVFLLLRLSKYYLKMDTKFYWNQHDTYSTIPDKEKGKPVPLFPTFPPKY